MLIFSFPLAKNLLIEKLKLEAESLKFQNDEKGAQHEQQILYFNKKVRNISKYWQALVILKYVLSLKGANYCISMEFID